MALRRLAGIVILLCPIVLNSERLSSGRLSGAGMNAEEDLAKFLFTKYLKFIRPSKNLDEAIVIEFSTHLLQLISVDVKTGKVTTSQYLKLRWQDPRLQWNPRDFSGLTGMRVPSEFLWTPDIALSNNVDGLKEKAHPVNAILNHTGYVEWMPPAIYKSACQIQVEYFPFDWQNCTLRFQSSTYNAKEVVFYPVRSKVVVDNEAYTDNGEWRIIHCPVKVNADPPNEEHQDVTLYFIIQRKPLFYIVNIIIPCILISLLSNTVFWLPCGCSEKITMSISVLLGLPVYLLLLAKRVSATSHEIPVIGSFVLFTMLCVSISVVSSVCVLNVYHRTHATHVMGPWQRWFLLEFLSRFLCRDTRVLLKRRLNLLGYANTVEDKASYNDVAVLKDFHSSGARQQGEKHTSCIPTTRMNNARFERNLVLKAQYLRNITNGDDMVTFKGKNGRHTKLLLNLECARCKNAGLGERCELTYNNHSFQENRRHCGSGAQSNPLCYNLDDHSHAGNLVPTSFSRFPYSYQRKPDYNVSGLLTRGKNGTRNAKKLGPNISLGLANREDMITFKSKHRDIEKLTVNSGKSTNIFHEGLPLVKSIEFYKLSKQSIIKSGSRQSKFPPWAPDIRNSEARAQLEGSRKSYNLLPSFSDDYSDIESMHTSPNSILEDEDNFFRERITGKDRESLVRSSKITKRSDGTSFIQNSGEVNQCYEEASRTTNKTRIRPKNEEDQTPQVIMHAMSPDATDYLKHGNFICQHFRSENVHKQQNAEWKVAAEVLDILICYLFMVFHIAGCVGFAVKALTNFPPERPFAAGDAKYVDCWEEHLHS